MRTFMGYRRSNGTVGTRNYVVVLPTVNCVNDTAYQMCLQVPGTFPLLSSLACAFAANDKIKAERVMKGILKNPNVYAAVIVGVDDCEPCSAEYLAAAASDTGKKILPLSLRDYSDFDTLMKRGVDFLKARYAETQSMKREECPLSDIAIITKCGGSGAISILSNNAAVGQAVDMLVDEGGSAIFAETAELLGIDKIIAARCATPELGKRLIGIVDRLKADIDHFGIDIMGSEPVPGNVKAGLSTIEEKSIGSVAKSGSRRIIGIQDFAEPLNSGHGLYFMDSDSPGEAVYCGGAAAGANLGVFSFPGGIPGRARSMVASVSGLQILPTVKVLGSNEYPEQAKDADVYTGDVLSGTISINEAGERLFERIIKVASGEKTFTEKYAKYYGPLNYFRNNLVL